MTVQGKDFVIIANIPYSKVIAEEPFRNKRIPEVV